MLLMHITGKHARRPIDYILPGPKYLYYISATPLPDITILTEDTSIMGLLLTYPRHFLT